MVLKVQDEYMCWLYKYTQILLKGELDEHEYDDENGYTKNNNLCFLIIMSHKTHTTNHLSLSLVINCGTYVHTVLAIVRKRQSFFKALLSAGFSLLC